MNNGVKILLVEDEPAIIRVTEFRLTKAGFNVVVATDGQMGLDMAASEKPALIFLDLGLPIVPGREVCARLKADDNLKHIPVVIFSASSDDVHAVSEAVGADAVITKPYDPEELIATVHELVGSAA